MVEHGWDAPPAWGHGLRQCSITCTGASPSLCFQPWPGLQHPRPRASPACLRCLSWPRAHLAALQRTLAASACPVWRLGRLQREDWAPLPPGTQLLPALTLLPGWHRDVLLQARPCWQLQGAAEVGTQPLSASSASPLSGCLLAKAADQGYACRAPPSPLLDMCTQ